MRRILLGGLGATALVFAAPGSALARSHSHHRHHHSHHAARVRIERFGPSVASSSPTSTPTTTTPAAPAPMSDNAGTVASFASDGTLTITLNDGSTVVVGLVTPNTQIECMAAVAQMSDNGGGSGSSDGNGDNGNTVAQNGDDNGAQSGDDNGDQNDNAQGDDQGDNQGAACGPSSLVKGAIVHEAELRVSSSGREFMNIELA